LTVFDSPFCLCPFPPPPGFPLLPYTTLFRSCTDDVHPDVAHAASLAARVVGLDIAGIDLVVSDVSRPLAAQRGAVVEVNAGPGLDRKSTRLNSSHVKISYAVFCVKKKTTRNG